jgi:ParB family chromosome partitioning protein
LKLPAIVQTGVKQGVISMGHARSLVSAGDEAVQVELFERVVAENLSVRDLEAIIRGEAVITKEPTPKIAKPQISETEYTFKEHLGDQLATKVDIKKAPNGSGKIIVNFSSDVDLNRIMELLNRR